MLKQTDGHSTRVYSVFFKQQSTVGVLAGAVARDHGPEWQVRLHGTWPPKSPNEASAATPISEHRRSRAPCPLAPAQGTMPRCHTAVRLADSMSRVATLQPVGAHGVLPCGDDKGYDWCGVDRRWRRS